MSCQNKVAITYEDILLVPQYSEIESRSEVDLSSNLGLYPELKYPIISAPMDTVTGIEMALEMDRLGGLGIIHRYNTIQEQNNMVRELKRLGAKNIAVAVGVTGDYFERAQALVSSGANIICVDIAHGHHVSMKKALAVLKERFTYTHIMAGNIATAQGYKDLSDWGADSVKIGIGNGSICSTRIHTGHGVPSVTAIMECSKISQTMLHPAKIIADGGIRNSGDIVKALAVGADFVMLGSLFAGTKESPGELINTPNGSRKIYRGMASREAQTDWRGKSSAPEGISTTIPYKGELESIFMDLIGGIKSGFSYTGAKNISEFQAKAKFIQQTRAGQHESWTHILSSSQQ